MTAIADTRFLIILTFPTSDKETKQTRDLFEKELRGRLILPAIVVTEYIKIAGLKVGDDAAKTKLRLMKEKGVQIIPFNEEQALAAGSLLLSHQNAPIADVIIASLVKLGLADYVLSDDQHFKALGVKTKWLQ